jgi:hypothetical protein
MHLLTSIQKSGATFSDLYQLFLASVNFHETVFYNTPTLHWLTDILFCGPCPYSNFSNETRRFGSWACFRLQARKEPNAVYHLELFSVTGHYRSVNLRCAPENKSCPRVVAGKWLSEIKNWREDSKMKLGPPTKKSHELRLSWKIFCRNVSEKFYYREEKAPCITIYVTSSGWMFSV